MPEDKPDEAVSLSQQQAEEIAKLLNMVFNNATLYGGKHPFAQKSSSDLASFLKSIFNIVPMVNLLRIGSSLYLDKYCVDRKINVSRFINHFQRTGIESISFENGATEDDLKVFVQVCTDLHTFPTIVKMNEELMRRGVSKVLLNYVFFQKVTKDDAVVNKDTLKGGGTPGVSEGSAASGLMLSQVSKLITLRDLLDNPNKAANDILEKAENDPHRNAAILNQLKEINNQIKTDAGPDSGISVDEILKSVLTLAAELKQRLLIQKEMGTIGDEEERVINEVDKLTCQTIIQIIRDEYKSGSMSVKRLSQIIRRILPDINDLKKMLPLLKEGLLAEGMKLADFLQLTKELNRELKNEGLIEILENGAKQIGLTLDEIVHAINTSPQEAAKIIVLASEISQQGGSDQLELSKLLTDYIESVGSKITLQSPQAAGRDGGKVLTRIIHQVETQLMHKLKVQGISDDLLKDIEAQLSERFPKTINNLKAEWIASIIAAEEDLSLANLAKMLETVVSKKTDIDVLKQPIEKALLMRGFKYTEVENVFKEISATIEQKSKSVSLLKILLGSQNTTFFIQRLIKENLRYKNPFCCIAASIHTVNISGSWQPPTPDVISKVMSDICVALRSLLRDLDLIGSLGKLESNRLFILLPMTNETGANIVKKRFEEFFSEMNFTVDEETVQPHIIMSVTPFDGSKTKEYKSFIELIKEDHVKEAEKSGKL